MTSHKQKELQENISDSFIRKDVDDARLNIPGIIR